LEKIENRSIGHLVELFRKLHKLGRVKWRTEKTLHSSSGKTMEIPNRYLPGSSSQVLEQSLSLLRGFEILLLRLFQEYLQ